MKRLTIGMALACSLLVLSAGAVLAKGPGSTPTLDKIGTPRAGEPTTVGVTLISDTGRQVVGDKVTFVFSRIADSQTVRAEAVPQGPPGHYAARVSLPASGGWNLLVTGVDGAGESMTWNMGVVRAAAAAPAASAPSTTPTAAAMPFWAIAAVIGVALLVILGGVVMANRQQRGRRAASARG